ncbi:nucleotide-diphospho-sugar transferase [Chaetomium tenue]|uniref:Nucleotide-diphospho-sugar transferase n=1 Tax=Chaetomium tenue TaxID=1854479 RepID=A0ACB7P075_9PEZI|nr:nucleotide-diphospho-sugar transferase [Chaetomium globosum]
MLSTYTPKKCLFPLLAIVTLLFLSAGHYSYKTRYGEKNILNRPPGGATTPSTLLQQPFPPKIWQSWKDDSENPTERTIGFPHQWRATNPSWLYERITDANMDTYIQTRFAATDPSLADLFTSLHDPILRADFLRYLILLRDGGVWADIDVYPHRPVAEWVPERFRGRVNLVVGIENDHHKKPIWPGSPYSVQLAQYTVLAKPGHLAVGVLVEEVAGNLRRLVGEKAKGGSGRVTFEDVMSTTGPFAFTRVLMEYFTNVTGVVHTGDEFDRMEEPRLIGDVLVLPKDSFGWLPQEHTHEKGDPMILVEHLFIASWRAGHPG